MDEPYSPESVEILDQVEEASVKSEPPEPSSDEPKVKSVSLRNYGELTVASFSFWSKIFNSCIIFSILPHIKQDYR